MFYAIEIPDQQHATCGRATCTGEYHLTQEQLKALLTGYVVKGYDFTGAGYSLDITSDKIRP